MKTQTLNQVVSVSEYTPLTALHSELQAEFLFDTS